MRTMVSEPIQLAAGIVVIVTVLVVLSKLGIISLPVSH